MSLPEYAVEMKSLYRKFKQGDTVIKARPWKPGSYCACGGKSSEVPIGTVGKVTKDSHAGSNEGTQITHVKFSNDTYWSLESRELDLVRSTGNRQ
jgi:hypothetical protein